MLSRGRVLVVEDEPVSREVLIENLLEVGCESLGVADGENAWRTLQEQPDGYAAVLLDRQLPDMDGLDLLRRIKNDPTLLHLPVILQTAMDAHEEVLEGLRAGAYYYLTKPIAPDTLLAIVETAVGDYNSYQAVRREAEQASNTLRHLEGAEFSFRTPAEARDIATLLANACPDGRKVVVGLSELMLNAVEHGNLAITYEEKSVLIAEERLQREVELRLELPRFAARRARVTFRRTPRELHFLIADEGQGFDWRTFMEMRPERAFDNHGRGIAVANMLSFQRLEYQAPGNRVLAVVALAGG